MPSFASLEINWPQRSFRLDGMEGDQPEEQEMHLSDLVEALLKPRTPDTELVALVIFEDVNQLACYLTAAELLEAAGDYVPDADLANAQNVLQRHALTDDPKEAFAEDC